MDSNQLTREIETALNDYSRMDEYEVSARRCTSDRFDGVEYKVDTSGYIPIDDVLDVVREHDKLFVEQVGVPPEGDGARMTMFVVEATIDPEGNATLGEMRR